MEPKLAPASQPKLAPISLQRRFSAASTDGDVLEREAAGVMELNTLPSAAALQMRPALPPLSNAPNPSASAVEQASNQAPEQAPLLSLIHI